MSQHDMIIDNAAGTSVRADLNLALQALASNSSGTSAPGTPYAGQFWWDTNTPSTSQWTLNVYDGTDWIEIGQLDVSGSVFYATATNAAQDTNTTQVATTAYVINQGASKAVMEAASTFTRYVSPGRQHSHPSATKAWATFAVSGGVVTIGDSWGVASISRISTGVFEVTWSTAFATSTYAPWGMATGSGIGFVRESATARTTTTCRFEVSNNTGTALVDPPFLSIFAVGKQ